MAPRPSSLLSLVLLPLVGCPQEIVPPANQPPEVRIFAPVEGATIDHGTALNLSGSCIDPEGEEVAIAAVWSTDLQGELWLGAPDNLGNVLATAYSLLSGAQTLTLTCTDQDGMAASRAVSIFGEPNIAPAVAIDEPRNGDGFTTDDTIAVEIRVHDDVDPVDQLLVSVASDLDGELESNLVPAADGSVLALFTLFPGEHVLTVSAVDLEGGVGTTSVAILVTTDHLPPGCTILEPQDDGFTQGEPILFRGAVNDPDVLPEEIVVHWESDLDGEFAEAAPDSVGTVSTWWSDLTVGEHIVTMRAVDEVHLTCLATTSVTVCPENDPPVVTIDLPAPNSSSLHNDPVVFSATVSDDLSASEDLLIEWSSDIDGSFNTTSADSAGLLYFQYAGLSGGQHSISLVVRDACGKVGSSSVIVIVEADDDGDGELASPVGDDCDDQDPLTYPGATEIPYDGIDQNCDGVDLDDLDNDGYVGELALGGTDCDDTSMLINPGATDIPYDGIDQDCSGGDLLDVDGDGFEGGVNGTDCNDNNPALFPGAVDVPYNQIDEDCSGADSIDVDGDGFGATAEGGSDCDDTNPGIFPGAVDIAYDGIDQDCNGSDRVDADADGYDSAAVGGVDCDDQNAGVYPGAPETPYDGVDQDCSGSDLNDVDGDGYLAVAAGGNDCDDANASVHPGLVDIPYNGIDENCLQGDEVDVDNDGWNAIIAGGTDCNDTDVLTHPNAADIPYDGIDQDCQNGDLVDVDNDGYLAQVVGGTDCNDYVPTVYPGAVEVPNDTLDNDCNGFVDDVTPTAVPEVVGEAYLCNPITISGAASYGPPGPSLSYQWGVGAIPTGSSVTIASIASPTAITTTFTPDLLGVYVLTLSVTQGPLTSTTYLVIDVIQNPSNQAPTAAAGADQTVSHNVTPTYSPYYGWSCSSCPGQTVTLNGSASSDPDLNPLTYLWQIVAGSGSVASATAQSTSATINGGSVSYNSSASFSATFQLTVSDCESAQGGDSMVVTYNCTCM